MYIPAELNAGFVSKLVTGGTCGHHRCARSTREGSEPGNRGWLAVVKTLLKCSSKGAAIPIDRTLTEHWNGGTWSVVASPNVGGNDNLLNGVAAITGDVWAVGCFEVTAHTLILRETG